MQRYVFTYTICLSSDDGVSCVRFSGTGNNTFCGDAMQHTAQIESAGKSERYDYRHCFSLVENEIKSGRFSCGKSGSSVGRKTLYGISGF